MNEIITESRVGIRIDILMMATCLTDRLLYLCLFLESAASLGHQSSLQREPRRASVNFVGNSCILIKFTAAGAARYQAETEG
jgi:hypothetical protein